MQEHYLIAIAESDDTGNITEATRLVSDINGDAVLYGSPEECIINIASEISQTGDGNELTVCVNAGEDFSSDSGDELYHHIRSNMANEAGQFVVVTFSDDSMRSYTVVKIKV